MQLITQIGIDNALLDVAGAILYAEKLVSADNVAVVGFCLGGTLAWLSATRLNAKAAVGYYRGRISNYVAEQPRCPVMLHVGALDKHIPTSEIDKIQHADPGLPLFLYENAGHGFNCDQRADYNPSAASLARERTLNFLRSHV
jgi:carboxymethylenebutenolidase